MRNTVVTFGNLEGQLQLISLRCPARRASADRVSFAITESVGATSTLPERARRQATRAEGTHHGIDPIHPRQSVGESARCGRCPSHGLRRSNLSATMIVFMRRAPEQARAHPNFCARVELTTCVFRKRLRIQDVINRLASAAVKCPVFFSPMLC